MDSPLVQNCFDYELLMFTGCPYSSIVLSSGFISLSTEARDRKYPFVAPRLLPYYTTPTHKVNDMKSREQCFNDNQSPNLQEGKCVSLLE